MLQCDRVPAFTRDNKLELLAIARRYLAHPEKDLMRDILAGLTPKQTEAALCIYILNMTEDETATVLGVSQTVIAKRKDALLEKARENISILKGLKKKKASLHIM